MFCMIIETIMPLEYYSNMVGALLDQKIFQTLLKDKIPDLAIHLKEINCEPSIIAF